jgi:hypothetical protein
MSGELTLSRDQVLDELDVLATVEHALCVEYLSIHCALGHDLPPADSGATAQHVHDAAQAAFVLALGEMHHLHRINLALTHAGRPAQVSRASNIAGVSVAEIALGPPCAVELERLLDREHEIAAAVDAKYARLHPAVASQHPLFEGDVLERMSVLLDPSPDHSTPLGALEEQLESVNSDDYLRATPRDPANPLERSLLELSDRYYALIVATLQAWFAHEDQLGTELPGRAFATMDGLHATNGLLVERGLLPAFTLLVS